METETRTAPVSLSDYHAGQIIQHEATIEAEGHYRPDGTDAFGRVRYVWQLDRARAHHVVLDRSDRSEERVASPWMSTTSEAEDWLMRERDLIISATGPLRAAA